MLQSGCHWTIHAHATFSTEKTEIVRLFSANHSLTLTHMATHTHGDGRARTHTVGSVEGPIVGLQCWSSLSGN